MIRCGSCGRTLNALARLYPDFPDDDTPPVRPTGMPPLVQPHVEQEEIIAGADTATDGDGEPAADRTGPVLHLDLEPEPPPLWARLVWPLLAVVLAGAAGMQLFGPDRWRVDLDLPGFGAEELIPVPDAVQIVSRDMHAHPSLDDAVVISAVLINRANRAVPWPDIEIRLFDASQQPIGRRLLAPPDYLADDVDTSAGFAPDTRLPLVLELAVGATRPVGFSMSFHHPS